MAIPTRIDTVIIGNNGTTNYSGGATNYMIETPTGALYQLIIDANADPAFVKSVDYGLTWSAPTVLKNITTTQLAVWYDRWTDPTGVLGDLIHVVYTDSGSDDVFYRTINTASSDSLGTERTVFAGASTANGGAISIARMRGGNILVAGSIDAGVENYAYKSNDYFATSTAISNPYEASPDKLILMPGWGGVGDENDAMCFYFDNSGTEVSVKYYDDSGDSWAETSIATSITHPDHTSGGSIGHWSATVDHTTSKNLIAFWTAVDSANANLRVFSCSQSAQTETASNVVLNSTDDQGFCFLTIYGSSWYCYYLGKSDGSETYASSLNIYYKISTDGGANWGAETKLNIITVQTVTVFFGCPITYKTLAVLYFSVNGSYQINTRLAIPHTTFQLGM